MQVLNKLKKPWPFSLAVKVRTLSRFANVFFPEIPNHDFPFEKNAPYIYSDCKIPHEDWTFGSNLLWNIIQLLRCFGFPLHVFVYIFNSFQLLVIFVHKRILSRQIQIKETFATSPGRSHLTRIRHEIYRKSSSKHFNPFHWPAFRTNHSSLHHKLRDDKVADKFAGRSDKKSIRFHEKLYVSPGNYWRRSPFALLSIL